MAKGGLVQKEHELLDDESSMEPHEFQEQEPSDETMLESSADEAHETMDNEEAPAAKPSVLEQIMIKNRMSKFRK